MFRYKKLIIGVLALALLTVWYLTAAENSEAQVVFLNVGQGDATLITLPGGVQILTDGGPSRDIIASLQHYLPFDDRTIELLVLSHPHADHVRGLSAVLDTYRVEAVLLAGAFYQSGTYERFINRLGEKEVTVYLAQKGDSIFYRDEPLLRVLAPTEPMLGREPSHIHEANVVTEATLGGMRFLLTGDMEEALERELVEKGLVRDSDVLKVGHQGSKTSSGSRFLSRVLPEVAVISVGENTYGHPHQEVLDRFKKLGSHTLRTDKNGDIIWTFQLE